jgi:hypothetical protein
MGYLMQEIWIPEFLIAVFLFLPILRPRIKKLWPFRGIVWFSLIALFLAVGLFPAYGFRMEAVPLLIFAAAYNFFNFPRILSGIGWGRREDFFEESHFFTLPLLALLFLALGGAVYFSPTMSIDLITQGIYTVPVRDQELNRDLFFRIYLPAGLETGESAEKAGAEASRPRPLLILIPPLTGSVTITDRICGDLRDKGFMVLTYSRRGFDSPSVGEGNRRYGSSLGRQIRYFRAFSAGARRAGANLFGRVMESGRMEDLNFLLSWLRLNPRIAGFPLFTLVGTDAVFVAGYGAGGSALAAMASSPQFTRNNPFIRGIITLESPHWSSFREEKPDAETLPRGSPWYLRAGHGIKTWIMARGPKGVRLGLVPLPLLPHLMLVSDRALDQGPPAGDWSYAQEKENSGLAVVEFPDQNPPKEEKSFFPVDRRYEGAYKIFQNSPSPVILAALEGAGPLDYTDCPAKYPLFSALYPGRKKNAPRNGDSFRTAAALISNFAAILMEDVPENIPSALPRTVVPQKTGLGETVYQESRGWNLPSLQYILTP